MPDAPPLRRAEHHAGSVEPSRIVERQDFRPDIVPAGANTAARGMTISSSPGELFASVCEPFIATGQHRGVRLSEDLRPENSGFSH